MVGINSVASILFLIYLTIPQQNVQLNHTTVTRLDDTHTSAMLISFITSISF
jgi:hypothetical protein